MACPMIRPTFQCHLLQETGCRLFKQNLNLSVQMLVGLNIFCLLSQILMFSVGMASFSTFLSESFEGSRG